MAPAGPLVTYRVSRAAEPEACSELFVCATAEYVALALGTALLFLFFLAAAIAHVRSAHSATTEERQRIRDEADAFAEFARRISGLDAGPTPGGGRTAGTTALVESAAASPTRAVREAYRSTVMAVPHYESEYDEPLARNMAAEFGGDVADAVSTGGPLTPQLKETLLQRSRRSHRLRLALLDHLDDEADDLAAAKRDFERIDGSVARIESEPLEDASFEELVAEWYLLEDRERECVDRLQARQETVHSRRGLARHLSDAPTLEEYLYAPLDVTYPVLADGTRLLGRLRAARSRILMALTSTT